MGNIVGTHANAWSAASVAVNGTSAAIDLEDCAQLSVFGNTSGASTLTLQMSADRVNWYNHPTTIAANGNFAQVYTVGARYARLHSSAAVTITATIQAKQP